MTVESMLPIAFQWCLFIVRH